MTDKYFCRGSVGKFTEGKGVLAVNGFEYVVFSHIERPLTLNNNQSKNISVNCLTFVKINFAHRAIPNGYPCFNGWVTELCNVPYAFFVEPNFTDLMFFYVSGLSA